MSRLLFYIEIATIQTGDMWLVAIGLHSATNGRTKVAALSCMLTPLHRNFPKVLSKEIEQNKMQSFCLLHNAGVKVSS